MIKSYQSSSVVTQGVSRETFRLVSPYGEFRLYSKHRCITSIINIIMIIVCMYVNYYVGCRNDCQTALRTASGVCQTPDTLYVMMIMIMVLIIIIIITITITIMIIM